MLLNRPRAGIQTESPVDEGDADLAAGENSSKPEADIVGGDLDEEYRIRGISGSKRIHRRQESSRHDEDDREDEISKRQGGQSRIIVETDDPPYLGGDLADFGVILVFEINIDLNGLVDGELLSI